MLWPPLVSVALDEDVQRRRGLSASARAVLRAVEEQGAVQSQQLPGFRSDRKRHAADIRELEERLLVLSAEVHTASGAHAKQLESWRHWAARRGAPLSGLPTVSESRRMLEATLGPWLERGRASVPWRRD